VNIHRRGWRVTLCTVVACGGASADGSSAGDPRVPRRGPVHIDLPSDSGDLVSLPLAGRATVVDAWAPSCAPCRDAVPALVKRQTDLEGAGVKLVLVAVLAEDESTELARTTLASWGVKAPFLVDRGDVLRREAGISSLPSTLFLSPEGEVRWISPLSATADDIVRAARVAQ
jgi:thiol-disulfide isomerase/thioredoxin